MIIYTYGMETSFFHFSEKEKTSPDKVFGTGMMMLILSTIVFSGTIILFSENLAQLLDYSNHPEYIVWLALIIGFDALTALPFARLRQQQKAVKFAGLKLLGIGINIFFNVFFYLILPAWSKMEAGFLKNIADTFYNPDIGVGYVFISNLLASAFTLLLMLPQMRFRFSWFDMELLRKILLYSSPLLIAGLAGMANETLDRIMIKYLIEDRTDAMIQLGIYGACYKLSILMTLFIQAFRYAAEPFFFSQFRKKDATQTYAMVLKYFAIACSVIFLVIMFYLDIIRYFIGKTYWEGLNAVPVLLMANIFLGIFFNLSMWYKLTGKTHYGAWLAIFGAIITVVFNLALIPIMGYMGAAWTTLICYGSMMAASYFVGQKQYYIPYQTGRILSYIAIAPVLYLASEVFHGMFNLTTPWTLVVNTILLLTYIFALSRFENWRPKSTSHES